ncbi:nicotinamide N-methyltransferase-like [Pelobates fuscus]|uniref:nicotinamide N-methyltransferase-like n=1 Tax=Pelobates fuscus TaxID=191477 RepID=UPI002FE48698
MEAATLKHYHDEEFDPQMLVKMYISEDKTHTKEELLEYPMKVVYELCSTGTVKGETLIDLSGGPDLGQLLVAGNFYKEITVLESSVASQEEIQRWLNRHPDAIDWSHATRLLSKLIGGSISTEELEEKTRRAIKHCLLWDPTKDNPVEPDNLPLADTLLSTWYLEAACKDHDSYRNYLKKFLSYLKVGGHIILFYVSKCTHYTIHQHRFSTLNYEKEFVQTVLLDSGIAIERSSLKKSKVDSHQIKYENVGYFLGHKEKQV